MIEKYFKDLLDYFLVAKGKNHSLNNQDLFVLYFSQSKKSGFFVDVGAGDGVDISNTYLLEKTGWQGILVDPVNYNSGNMKLRQCIKDNRCVYSKTGLKISFAENPDVPVMPGSPHPSNFSGILKHLSGPTKKDGLYKVRDVETVSLNDLLEQYNAPNKIDYISIDTEGSEFEIVSNFDFNKYDVEIFTIEHNYASFREDLVNLLNYKGYFRMPNEYQGGFVPSYEDWFIKNNNIILKKILTKLY
jgi:FkbM family methyltransferase